MRMARRLRDLGVLRAIGDETVGQTPGIELHTVIASYALAKLHRHGEGKGVHKRPIATYRGEGGYAGGTLSRLLPVFRCARLAVDDTYFGANIARHA